MVAHDPDLELQHSASGEDEDDGLERIWELAGFVVRAGGRRPKLAAITFMIVAVLGIALAKTMPRTYSTQVKMLAQRSSALRLLTSPNRDMNAVDNPTKNVADLIMRRDNIVALVKETHLVARFDATRSPALKFKDRIMTWINGPLSDDDKLRSLVGMLEARLYIFVDESTVVISVDWPNPEIAYELVTLVQKNFLEARYDSDVAVITDSIGVLQDHAKTQLAQVDTALEEYSKLLAARAQAAVVRPTPTQMWTGGSAAPAGVGAPPVDPELTNALEEKRLQIRTLEGERQHALDALRQQLMSAQLTLTPMHPTVISLQQAVDSMSQPSPELVQLRKDERALMAQIVPLPPTATPRIGATPIIMAPSPTAATETTGSRLSAVDGPLQLAQSNLGLAIHGYEDLMARIDAANIELDITRTAYKYRYTVVTPAEVPSRPKKPIAAYVGAGSIVGGALLAMIVAAFADLAAGLILEGWQVRRRLKVEVLGEVELPL
jgi:uncharacterized protein involved in exopolysaccharide biosynthesis